MMRQLLEERLPPECITEILALEEKWGVELCTKALLEAQRPLASDTSNINRRLAQLERCMWGHECGPRD